MQAALPEGIANATIRTRGGREMLGGDESRTLDPRARGKKKKKKKCFGCMDGLLLV